jgi:hypothetical protein
MRSLLSGGDATATTKAGIFDLPDSSQLKGEKGVLDGVSYVVEYRRGAEYRTYMYANPEHQSWPEARRMENIIYSVHCAFSRSWTFTMR